MKKKDVKHTADIVHWSAGSKPLELVKSGEVVMSIAYNGRVGAANLAEGENFEYIWRVSIVWCLDLVHETDDPYLDSIPNLLYHVLAV